MKVYLAGPMRGIPDFNFPAFMSAAARLEARGIEVFNPAQHDVDEGFTFEGTTGLENLAALGFDLRKALGTDLEFICREADAVVVLPGWERSSGANAEVATALALGLMVWEFDAAALTRTEMLDGHDARAMLQREFGVLPAVADEIDQDTPLLRGEIRVRSETGGEKGSKLARFDLIPQGPLWQVAELYGKGAEKYAERNWERGYPWHLSFAAMQRHGSQFWSGENRDPETGCHPLAAVIFHAMGLMEFEETHPEFDDRPRQRTLG